MLLPVIHAHPTTATGIVFSPAPDSVTTVLPHSNTPWMQPRVWFAFTLTPGQLAVHQKPRPLSAKCCPATQTPRCSGSLVVPSLEQDFAHIFVKLCEVLAHPLFQPVQIPPCRMALPSNMFISPTSLVLPANQLTFGDAGECIPLLSTGRPCLSLIGLIYKHASCVNLLYANSHLNIFMSCRHFENPQ